MNGNVALLTLKVAEWAKMMQQQPQEWMSAVFSSTDLGKGCYRDKEKAQRFKYRNLY